MHPAKLIAASLALAAAAAAQCTTCGNAPPGVNLLLTDDSVLRVALPFTWTFNGIAYNDITVGSNGWIKAGNGGTATELGDSTATMLSGAPRIAAVWDDLNPTAGGGVYCSIKQDHTQVSICWQAVPRFGSTTAIATVETIITATNQIVIASAASTTMNLATSTVLVGISAGGGAAANAQNLDVFAGGAPIVGATVYEQFTINTGLTPYDLAGQALMFLPQDAGATQFQLTMVPTASLPVCAQGDFDAFSRPGVTRIGSPCFPTVSAYEEFTPSTGSNPVDLSGTSTRWVRAGNSYVATTGGGMDLSYIGGTPLVAGDEVRIENLNVGAMGSFPFGTSTSISNFGLSSNGFLYPTGAAASADFSPSSAEMLSQFIRFAPLWGDWSTNQGGVGLGGAIFWTPDAGSGFAMATYENIAEFGNTGTQNTFQAKFYASGDFEFSYGAVASVGDTQIAGWSQGGGAANGATDISAAAANSLLKTLGRTDGLNHTNLTTPTLGTTYTVQTQNIPATAPFGATVTGFSQTNIDLTGIGMGGCRQYVVILSQTLAILGGSPTMDKSFTLPATTSLYGVPLVTQGVVFSPGTPNSTPLGAITSNGILGAIGL